MQPFGASYQVVRLLGEGGIGRVYEAIHHPSGRRVAIKTLRSEHGGPTSQRLLLNEAAAVAQIVHPSIVELLDVGRDDTGDIFLVMELVSGANVEAWADRPPGLRTMLLAACDVLDALGTAHAQSIVHGDMKPANVLLTEDGRVKVTDFGIAHILDPLKTNRRRRGVQGTPYYMAPEQLADIEAIGPSTDLYALGVMLYELVAGCEPYPSSGTLGELLARKLLQVRPLEPRPGLVMPQQLQAIVMLLLHPDPRRRPRFAANVRATLRLIASDASDEPPSADGPRATRATENWATISSGDLPASVSTVPRSLPFSLPCVMVTPEVALNRLRPLPLLGRQTEAGALLALAARAERGSCGLVIAGRPGEGKSRLARHGFAEVERTGRMLGAAASFDETIAHEAAGLRACMRRLVGAPGRTTEESLVGRWSWLRPGEQADVDFELIHAFLSDDARPLGKELAVRTATMCVLAASRIYPVYLWLDDVAWSHDGAMELMVDLLQRKDARALVVATMRSGTAEHPTIRDWLLRVAAAGAELMMLKPFAKPERIALLTAACPLRHDVAVALAERLDEPPLVLVEAVRASIADGKLVSDGGEYAPDRLAAFRSSIDELASGVTAAVLGGRISTLIEAFGAEGERLAAERVLCHTALLGLRFEERALRRCADPAWIDCVLDRALLSGLLRVEGRGAYRFEHRAFLDVIVDRCALRPDAAEIFCATADALVTTYGQRNTNTGLGAAMLYRMGGAHERAVRVAGEVARAFGRANALDAADRTLALVASWVEALPPGHLHRALLEKSLGARHYYGMDYPRARTHLHRAQGDFERLGEVHDWNDTLLIIAATHLYQDHFGEVERCIARIDFRSARGVIRGRALHQRSELCAMRLDLASAVVHQRAAIETSVEEGADPLFAFVALATLAELLVAAGDVDGAAATAARLSEVVAGRADSFVTLDVERVLGVVDAAKGRFASARSRLLPRIAQLTARTDKWNLTADLALLALCSSAIDPQPDIVAEAVRALISAYTQVPHDEAHTWWAIRCTEAWLRGRGMEDLATELGRLIDRRLEHIARAFNDEEPITTEETPQRQ